jgi:O-Antigen ligase.
MESNLINMSYDSKIRNMTMLRKILTCSIILSIIVTIVLGNSATFDLFSGWNKGAPIKITEIIIGINLLVLAIINKLHIRKMQALNILILWIIYGIFAILINVPSFHYGAKDVLYGMLYALRVLFYILYVYYIVGYLKDEKYNFDKLSDICIYAYSFVAVIGFFQLYFFRNAYDFYDQLKKFKVYLKNQDPHVDRLISLYLDPNFLGSIIVIGIMLCLIKLIKGKLVNNIKYLIFIEIQLIALALTVSRSGIGSLLLSLMIFGLLSIKIVNRKIQIPNFKKILILVILMMVTVGTVYYLDHSRMVNRIVNIQTDPSAQARVKSWTNATTTANTTVKQKSSPIAGIGYNMIGFVRGTTNESVSFGVDSSLLLIFVTTGFIGLLIYFAYVLKTLWDVFRKRTSENYYEANAIIALFIAGLAASFFNNLLFYPLWLFPFLLISNFFLVSYSQDKYIK